jgi:hypothetical protein
MQEVTGKTGLGLLELTAKCSILKFSLISYRDDSDRSLEIGILELLNVGSQGMGSAFKFIAL